jgi:signal peptidase I
LADFIPVWLGGALMGIPLSFSGPGFWRWLSSSHVRRATELRRQVWRLVNEQRDLLPPDSVEAIEQTDRQLEALLRAGAADATVQEGMSELERVANQKLLPYPNAGARENIKEMAVAITVIFAFTSFFLQLTKIPTNSLVPTLYGITYQDLRGDPNAVVPGQLGRIYEYWVHGVSYCRVTAKADGALEMVEPPKLVVPFVKKQRLLVGDIWYTVWFPPERLEDRLLAGHRFHAGEDIIHIRTVAGDHLLVDRLSYNFRRPKRGEIFVFKTKGIPGLPEGQLYIKRLVALGGEHVRIGNDQHLIIDGKRLDAGTPHFENVYNFGPVPRENQYFGHVNELVAERFHRWGLAPLFRDETCEHIVAPRHYLAMGDNTMNSSDSRSWGDVPCQNVIGKCWFVYWPFTHRFGWGTR